MSKTPEDYKKICCITNCTNTDSNSTVDFFTFPEPRYRSIQRNKWIEAIRNNKNNDPRWLPSHDSVVCGAHFVKGKPGLRSQDQDYAPSVFDGMKEIKTRAMSVKRFALEYIKHDALLEKPTRTNVNADLRKCAYVKLAATLGIPVVTARIWERRFREYFEQKRANWPDKKKPPTGKPQWLAVVAKRLYANPMTRLSALSGGAATPTGVVMALVAAARARGTLCSTGLYNDVRRALRISAAINDLHAVWVSAQRVSLEQVNVAGRAGDVAPVPPPHAAQVADLVLLHSDVDMHRLVTDESVTLYEESAALHTLWQLVQRHRLEETEPMEPQERARRWTQAHRDYLDSGRCASLVVLQRRWHELKLQARVRLAAHWRRALPPRAPAYPAPPAHAPPAPAPPAPPPHALYPRPAPIHISILKRYPHIATGAFKNWRQLVLDDAVVTEPLESDCKIEEKKEEDNAQSHETTCPSRLDPNVEQLQQARNDDYNAAKPTVNETKMEKVSSELFVEHSVNDSLGKQTSDQTADEPIEKTTVNKPLVKQSTTGDPEQLDVPMNTDIMVEESVTEDCLAVKSTVNENRVDQIDPSTDNPVVDKDAVVETIDSDVLGEQNASNERMAVQLTVNDIKVEQAIGNDPSADNILTEQPTVNNLSAEQPSVIKRIDSNLLNEHGNKDPRLPIRPTVNELKVEKDTDRNSFTANPVTGQTTSIEPEIVSSTENDQSKVAGKSKDSDLLDVQTANSELSATKSTVIQPKMEQQMDNDLLDNSSTKDDTLDKSSVDDAYKAVSPNSADILDRPGISSEQILRAEDQSGEVIPRYRTQANTSETDTDTEDNLVIDECSNNTLCAPNQEQIAHTQTHSVDTLPSLGITAPTIAVLQTIDPSTVKTEILFESDEEEFQPCIEEDKVEVKLDTKENVSFIADKIMFADDEPRDETETGSYDVKIEDDFTERMDCEDAQESDELDNDNVDPKLLMDTKVLLFRIDKTRAWKNNVRKDNSIRVSRIHRRFYTPNPKKYYITLKSKAKRDTPASVTTKSKNNVSKAKTYYNTSSNTKYNTKKLEMAIPDSLLDKADTLSVRKLTRNIKRELLEGEHETPNKRVKPTSDTDDDQPLLVVRERPPSETDDWENTDSADGVRESSSDEELGNGEVYLNKYWDVKRKAGGRSAASTIEWSSEFGSPGAPGAPGAPGSPGAPERVAKRVRLPDREQLRRDHTGLRVAQVAPIKVDTTETLQDSGVVEPPGDAADEDIPLAWRALDLPADDQLEAALDELTVAAWRALDLPADDQLEAALDELTSASNMEQVLQRAPCCAARRHRDVNDARRRIGIAELPLHTHADGVCTCCCAHLCDGDVRARLDQQLRALHNDIERMLWKPAVGRSHSKAVQKQSRSPSPASTTATTKPTTTKPTTTKPTTTDLPSSMPTEAKSSKTYTNRSKQRRAKPRPATPPRASPSSPVDYYEEWQRQKTMNAQYFHINSSSKKIKPTPQTVTQSTSRQSGAQTSAQQSMTQTSAQQSMTQTTTPQSVAQTATRPSVITHSTIANSGTPTQTSQGGLMPYIRESPLIAPLETRPMMCIEVPTLLPVKYPRGTPARLIVQKPPKHVKPARVNTAQTVPVSKLQGTTPRPIAPKPESMRRAPKVLNTVEEEPQTTTAPTNVTTEQVAEPQTSTSQPVDKPLSILEEYSRTLSIEPAINKPVVNALSLRVPDGPGGPKTTIVMTLTVPSEEIIKQTINSLYANETVDLTKETDTPAAKTTEAQKIPPVVDIVAAVKSLITARNGDRSLLKPSNNTAGGNVPRNKAPMIMSLSSRLHDGDIIEIDDSSDESNDNHSNESSNLEKSIDTSNFISITSGTVNTLNKAISTNINKNSQQAAIKKDALRRQLDQLQNQATTSNISKPTKYSKLKKLLQTTSNTNNSNQAAGKPDESTSQANKTKTSSPSVSKATTSNQSVSKATTSNQSVSKATTTNQPSNQATSNIRKIKRIGRCQPTTSNSSTRKTYPTEELKSYNSLKERIKDKMKKLTWFMEGQHQEDSAVEAVELDDVAHLQALQSLTDGSERCPACSANVAAMPDFVDKLKAAAANVGKEVYTHKGSAIEVAASALGCGDMLLCADAARAPLWLPARGARARRYLVLTDAELPCAMPTFWTLAPFNRMSRVVLERVTGGRVSADGHDGADGADGTDRADGADGTMVASGTGGARWCPEKREWVMLKENKKICDRNHNFKILTAFCSADGVRQAARAGAHLYLLHVKRARVLVLGMARLQAGGDVRHCARADVKPDLLRELELLLDEAEIEEKQRARADVTEQ